MNIMPEDVDHYLYDAKKLLLDDDAYRTPEKLYGYTKNPAYSYPNWDIVRNFDQFVEYIQNHPMPRLISLDHDLADIHYKIYLTAQDESAKQIAWEDYHTMEDHEKTGYDCLKWLVDYCHDNNVVFPELLIHTMNSVGYNNMVFYYRAALRNKFIRIN